MLLYLSSGDLEGWSGFADGAHGCPEFAGEESFQAADDLGLRLSFGDAAGDVSLGGLVVLHANDDDAAARGDCLSVTAVVESVSGGHPCRDRKSVVEGPSVSVRVDL